MASLFFRRRISLNLLPDNAHIYLSNLEAKSGTSYGVYQCIRKLSSSIGSKKFDFTDLTHPHTWYPVARRKKRKVVLHVGPTNSGKTYHALKRLESCSTGIYCGPLRLLAWEVAQRLNKAKVPCDLITGQERQEIDGARHKAVTVEMADVTSNYDCAVVDEIQMLGCRTRGFSFTRALLGISADELHLCGDAAAVPLIQEILKVTDDVVEIQHYERLSPLVPLEVPLGSFSNIRTGDCIVTFSRYEIYQIKVIITTFDPSSYRLLYAKLIFRTSAFKSLHKNRKLIKQIKSGKVWKVGKYLHIHPHTRFMHRENWKYMWLHVKKHTNNINGCFCNALIINNVDRVELKIEGSIFALLFMVHCLQRLEADRLQATMFNDEKNNFDVLVASDAIGMGLNLNISRIIFSTLKKFDGFEMRDLTVSEIKQIAGRAGRYRSKFPVGEVTCLDPADLPLLHSSLSSPSPTLEQAGLFPNYDLLLMYSRLHPTYGLYQILEHFVANAKLSENYFITNCEQMLKVAAVIDELPLTLNDKYLFAMSPVDMDDDISSQGLTQFAQSYVKNHIVRLKEIFTPGTLKIPKSHKQLKELESIHKVLDLYVWLSFHMEECFPDRELAASQKALCSMLIEEFLGRDGWQKPRPRKLPYPTVWKSLS